MEKTSNPVHPIKKHNQAPSVVIVGRTNVGKSSLFNRILGRSISIVQPEHGTTVDLVSGTFDRSGLCFELYDSGGYSFSKPVPLKSEINQAVEKALGDASLILFVCDGQAGIHPQDELLTEKLLPHKHNVILIVNKLDRYDLFGEGDLFYRLGFNNLIKTSAENSLGMDELLDLIAHKLPETSGIGTQTCDLSLAIVGEPNSGKSTYFNALLNDERAIVSEMPGTTRDVLSESILYKGSVILIKDTAGLRPFRSKDSQVERFSMQRTKATIRHAEVVLLVCDAQKGLGSVSKKIAAYILEQKKACVIVINKWDLSSHTEQAHYEARLKKHASFLLTYPTVFISAKLRKNILRPLDTALNIYQKHNAQIKTNSLNQFLKKLTACYVIKENARLKYLTQIRTAPPHFLLMGRRLERLKPESVQFIKNSIQSEFDLKGTPIQLTVRNESPS